GFKYDGDYSVKLLDGTRERSLPDIAMVRRIVSDSLSGFTGGGGSTPVAATASFTVTGGTSMTLELHTVDNSSYQLDWGDGTVVTVGSGVQALHTYGSAFTGEVVITPTGGVTNVEQIFVTGLWDFETKDFTALTGLTRLELTGMETLMTGDVRFFPENLTTINLRGAVEVYGDLFSLPNEWAFIRAVGANNLSSNVANMPPTNTYYGVTGNSTDYGELFNSINPAMIHIDIQGNNNIRADMSDAARFTGMLDFGVRDNAYLYGDINFPSTIRDIVVDVDDRQAFLDMAEMPSTTNRLTWYGLRGLEGAISDIPSSIDIIDLRNIDGSPSMSGSWSNLPTGFSYLNLPFQGPSVYDLSQTYTGTIQFFLIEADGMASADVDRLLGDLSAATWATSGLRILEIRYTQGRSSASDADVSSLQSRGVTVNVNAGDRPGGSGSGDIVFTQSSGTTQGIELNGTSSAVLNLTTVSSNPFADGDIRYVRNNATNIAARLTIGVEAGQTYTIDGGSQLFFFKDDNAALQYNAQTNNWDIIGGNMVKPENSEYQTSDNTEQTINSTTWTPLTIWNPTPIYFTGSWFSLNAAEIRPTTVTNSDFRYRIEGHVNFETTTASSISLRLIVDGSPTGREWHVTTPGAEKCTINFTETTNVGYFDEISLEASITGSATAGSTTGTSYWNIQQLQIR
ncbi:MAG: hypothetical protein AAFU67_10815, partial [Bacteroidota bacterium]